MAKAFSEEEREIIYNKLIEEGQESIARYGYKKTSIDEIVHKVGISKGAFYKFFSSKEEFLFSVAETIDHELKKEAKSIIPKSMDNFKENTINAFADFLITTLRIPKYRTMLDLHEIEYLYRGVPKERINEHLKGDGLFIFDLFSDYEYLLKDRNELNVEFVAGMIMTILYTILHEEHIGVNVIDQIVKLQLNGLMDYILK